MFEGKKFLAVIPARAGSKRLPNKNILDFNGKPLIYWSIESAKKSKYIDKIVVSTDSKKIQELCISFDIEAPFLRPDYLSNDTASSYDTVIHSIDYYKDLGEEYDYVVLLQPTSPLRTYIDINNAIELLYEDKIDAVISVAESSHSPQRMNTLPSNFSMENFVNRKLVGKRTQELEKYYYIDGSIYICDINRLRNEKNFLFKDNIKAYKMEKVKSCDIDDIVDFKIAETLHKENS